VSLFLDAPHTGRKRVVTDGVSKWIVDTIQQPGQSASNVARILPTIFPGIQADRKTVAKYARHARLRWKLPRTVPLLTAQHRALRLAFCKKWSGARPEAVMNIVFTDEKNFRLFGQTHGAWGPVGVPNVNPQPQQGPRVLVWGGMGWHGKTPLYIEPNGTMNSDLYIQKVLEGIWLPYCDLLRAQRGVRKIMITQDGAPAHTSKKTMSWHKEHKTALVLGSHGRWPPNSPDINGPIENVWGDMALAVGDTHPKNLTELVEAIQEAWDNISLERLQKAISSWHARVRRIVDLEGFIFYPQPSGEVSQQTFSNIDPSAFNPKKVFRPKRRGIMPAKSNLDLFD
jgi:hypothetical protein